MARHDRGGGLAERAGFHLVGEVGDNGPVHLEVDLDRRPAQLGVGGGTGIGSGQASEPRNISRQLDDFLVVDVVQHGSQVFRGRSEAALAAGVHRPI